MSFPSSLPGRIPDDPPARSKHRVRAETAVGDLPLLTNDALDAQIAIAHALLAVDDTLNQLLHTLRKASGHYRWERRL